MSLDRIRNPRRLRQIARQIGQPVLAAYARWFAPQTTLLVFTAETTAWIVRRDGSFERYDGPVTFRDGGVVLSTETVWPPPLYK